jgi:hypothetical protein
MIKNPPSDHDFDMHRFVMQAAKSLDEAILATRSTLEVLQSCHDQLVKSMDQELSTVLADMTPAERGRFDKLAAIVDQIDGLAAKAFNQ